MTPDRRYVAVNMDTERLLRGALRVNESIEAKTINAGEHRKSSVVPVIACKASDRRLACLACNPSVACVCGVATAGVAKTSEYAAGHICAYCLRVSSVQIVNKSDITYVSPSALNP